MLTASNAPINAPALLVSKSILELVRVGKYICRYSMLADNNTPRHRPRITLTNALKRVRNISPTSKPNGK